MKKRILVYRDELYKTLFEWFELNTNGNREFIPIENLKLEGFELDKAEFTIASLPYIDKLIKEYMEAQSSGIKGEVFVVDVADMENKIIRFGNGETLTLSDGSPYSKTNALIGDRIQFRRADNNTNIFYPELSTVVATNSISIVRTTYFNDIYDTLKGYELRIGGLEANYLDKNQILVKDGSVKMDDNYMPTVDKDIAVKEYVDNVRRDLIANEIDSLQSEDTHLQSQITHINNTYLKADGSVPMSPNYVPQYDNEIMTKEYTEAEIARQIYADWVGTGKEAIAAYSFEKAHDYAALKPDIALISQLKEVEIPIANKQFTSVSNSELVYTFTENTSILYDNRLAYVRLFYNNPPNSEEFKIEDIYNNGVPTINTNTYGSFDVNITQTSIRLTNMTTQAHNIILNNFRITSILQFGSASVSSDAVARQEIVRVENKFDTITNNLDLNKQPKVINVNGIAATTVEGALEEINNKSVKMSLIMTDKVYTQKEVSDKIIAEIPNEIDRIGLDLTIRTSTNALIVGKITLEEATAFTLKGLWRDTRATANPSSYEISASISKTSTSSISTTQRSIYVPITPTLGQNPASKTYVDDANAAQDTKINTNTADITKLKTSTNLPLIEITSNTTQQQLFALLLARFGSVSGMYYKPFRLKETNVSYISYNCEVRLSSTNSTLYIDYEQIRDSTSSNETGYITVGLNTSSVWNNSKTNTRYITKSTTSTAQGYTTETIYKLVFIDSTLSIGNTVTNTLTDGWLNDFIVSWNIAQNDGASAGYYTNHNLYSTYDVDGTNGITIIQAGDSREANSFRITNGGVGTSTITLTTTRKGRADNTKIGRVVMQVRKTIKVPV